ncbi:MAG: DUF1007 family protein [Pseudomonadota bacterium]
MGFALGCGVSLPAAANPDVWVTAKYVLRFNETAMTGVSIEWAFDRYASDHALASLDVDADGAFSADELDEVRVQAFDPFAQDNYFVTVIAGESAVPFSADAFGARIDDQHLVVRFTIVPSSPVDYRDAPVSISLHDESFFFDFDLAKENFLLVDGPFDGSCRFRVQPGEGPLAGHKKTIVLICGE